MHTPDTPLLNHLNASDSERTLQYPPVHPSTSMTSGTQVYNSRRRSSSHHVSTIPPIISVYPQHHPTTIHLPTFPENQSLQDLISASKTPEPDTLLPNKAKSSPSATTPPPPPYNTTGPFKNNLQNEDRKSFIGFPSPRTLRTLLDSSSRSIQINVHNYFSRSSTPTQSPTDPALLYSISTRVKHFVHTIRLPLMCLTWYASSALTNNAKKQILFQFKYPVSLTMAQFGAVIILCLLASTRKWMRIQAPSTTIARTILLLSICQLAGHTLTSMAISTVPVAFVHTVKALGPLFTVLINHFVLRSRSSSSVWVSLIPLTSGVVLACAFGKHTMAFQWVGFLLSALSTIVFVVQNIVSKQILSNNNHGPSKPASTIKLSNLSYDPLLPTHVNGDTTPPSLIAVPMNLDKINIMFYSSVLAWLAMIPMWLTSDLPTLLLSAQNIDVDRRLVFLFILNGISHFTQSLLAFTILAHVTTVTYSIVSLLKRIVVIVAAIAWFGDTVSGMQAVGVTLTFTGLWMYQQAKRGNGSTQKHSD